MFSDINDTPSPDLPRRPGHRSFTLFSLSCASFPNRDTNHERREDTVCHPNIPYPPPAANDAFSSPRSHWQTTLPKHAFSVAKPLTIIRFYYSASETLRNTSLLSLPHYSLTAAEPLHGLHRKCGQPFTVNAKPTQILTVREKSYFKVLSELGLHASHTTGPSWEADCRYHFFGRRWGHPSPFVCFIITLASVMIYLISQAKSVRLFSIRGCAKQQCCECT
jgi:hypothetical protein